LPKFGLSIALVKFNGLDFITLILKEVAIDGIEALTIESFRKGKSFEVEK
jgi:hypothetical protein